MSHHCRPPPRCFCNHDECARLQALVRHLAELVEEEHHEWIIDMDDNDTKRQDKDENDDDSQRLKQASPSDLRSRICCEFPLTAEQALEQFYCIARYHWPVYLLKKHGGNRAILLTRAEALRTDADVETTPSNTKHAGFYSKPENSIDHQPGAMAVARITSTSIATVSEKDHRRYIQTPVPSLDHVYRQIDAWLAIPGVQGRIDEAFWPILGEVLLRPGGPLDDITKPPALSSVGTKRSTPQSTSATRASTPECQVTRTTFNRKKRSWHQQTASAAPDIVAGLTQSKQARVYPPDNVRRERVAKDKTGRSGSIGDDTDVEPKLDVDNPNYARLAYGQMTQLVMAEHTRIRQECDQLVAQLHQLRSLFISALHSMREEQDDDMASPMADTLFGPINVKCPILPLATSVWSATGPSSWKVLGSFMDQVVQQTKALHRKRAPLKEECRRLQVAWMQFQSDHDQWQTECKHRTQETRKGNAKDRTRRFKV